MSQINVLSLLKRYPTTWFSLKDISDILGTNKSGTNRDVRLLEKWGHLSVMYVRKGFRTYKYVKYKTEE